MNDQMPPVGEQPKKNNNTMIIAIVAVVILCCCCISMIALWQYGDQLVNSLG